jgi:hypothetical protein
MNNFEGFTFFGNDLHLENLLGDVFIFKVFVIPMDFLIPGL